MLRTFITLSILLITFQKPVIEETFYGETAIRLEHDIIGPYFEVQIESADSTPQDPQYKYINMALNLHSSETFISESCWGFQNDSVLAYSINPKSVPEGTKLHQIDSPKHTIKGFPASANLIIDPKHLVLKSPNKITVATECVSKIEREAKKYVGSFGMGYKGDSVNNLLGDNKAFALSKNIYWELHLNPQVAESLRGAALFTLTSDDADWQITGPVTAGINDKIDFTADPTTLLFDLTYDDIGLPQPLFEYFLKGLEKVGFKSRTTLGNVLEHDYNGPLSALPNLILTVNKKKIEITPQQYLPSYVLSQVDKQGMINEKKFNLKITPLKNIEVSEDGDTTESYYKKIILGRVFFVKYYTVFDTRDGKISFYNNAKILPPSNTPSHSNKNLYYFLIGAAILLILSVIYYLKRSPKDTNYQSAPHEQTNDPYITRYQNP